MSKRFLACLVLVVHAGFAVAAVPGGLQEVLDDYPVPPGQLGLYIAPIDREDGVISVNGSTPFNPASVIKLLPSLAALETLTPAHQWPTHVYAAGGIAGGVLNGHLYIQGGGDPYLTVESLWALLRNVRAQGIDRIAGDIVVDDGVFESRVFDRSAFDDKPYRVYNGPADGLMVNFWAVRFTIRAHVDRVYIDAFPDSERLKIVNNIRHSNAPCSASQRWIRYDVSQEPGSVVVTFNGALSSRCRPVVMTRAVIPDEEYAQYVLPGLWRTVGGTLQGGVRKGAVPEDAMRLFSHPSRPLAEAILATNKFSNNVMARHLLLSLGSLKKERGIGLDDGIKALHDWIASQGLDVPGLNIVNGSGLSRDTRISARGMANVLRFGFHSRYAPEFLASLPIAGQDRALDSRDFQGGDGGVIRFKTGLIDHVRAMAGYVTSRRGDTYVVVLLVNHEGVHRGVGTRMQNAVISYVLNL